MSRRSGRKGKLFCFEGGDAAGKSTLALGVAQELSQRGVSPVMIDKKSIEGFAGLYLAERMRDLRKVLWDYPQDAPLWEWGDHHWFHLLISWFSVLDHCRVRPLLEAGEVVIVDNWYYKFAARFLLKSEFDRRHVLSSFQHLTEPDLVIFIDVDPRVSVTRRTKFSATESGRMDGHREGDEDSFVEYQSRVLDQLRSLDEGDWFRLDASHLSLSSLVAKASDAIAEALR